MKILMLCEYFPPYDFGGSEWSSFYLASDLAKKGESVVVLTPNYSDLKSEDIDFKVVRFPFYIKNKEKKQVSPFWQTNLLWVLWTSLVVIYYSFKFKVDVVHVQGKYFLPAAIVTKILLRKRVISTLRDYIVLCPLGMCLMRGEKVCSFKDFFLKDFWYYQNNYLSGKSLLTKGVILFFLIRARLTSLFLRSCLKRVDRKIAISKLVKVLYEVNGVKIDKVIYNSISFHKKVVSHNKTKDKIIYAGRLTPGKGPALLIEALKVVFEKEKKVICVFYGEGFMKKSLIDRAELLGIKKRVHFLGQITHDKLLSEISGSLMSVTPSVWPEPFGRLPLETLAFGVPVVVTKNTGVAEIIKDKRWGYLAGKDIIDIAQGILYVIKNNNLLRKNIKLGSYLIKAGSKDVAGLYIKSYRSL